MSHNTLIHQAVRPAIRLLAARTRVAPDHLTALRLVTGLGVAAVFAQGGGADWLLLGSCLFLFSALLDRADGELARQTRRFSRRGHQWDLLADCTCTVMVFVGLGVGAVGGPLGVGSVVLGACGRRDRWRVLASERHGLGSRCLAFRALAGACSPTSTTRCSQCL